MDMTNARFWYRQPQRHQSLAGPVASPRVSALRKEPDKQAKWPASFGKQWRGSVSWPSKRCRAALHGRRQFTFYRREHADCDCSPSPNVSRAGHCLRLTRHGRAWSESGKLQGEVWEVPA